MPMISFNNICKIYSRNKVFYNADLSIEASGTGNINLTAGADVVIPVNIGLILDGSGAEKIESDGTDISISVGANGDINIPADIGLTFGNDGEKIEGDGTDLTITGNNINLTATADVIIPTNVGLHFTCLLYTSPSPRDLSTTRKPSSA